MLDCHKAMLRLMGKSVDDAPKPRSGYGSPEAAMREEYRRQRDFEYGRPVRTHRIPKRARQTSSRKKDVKYPPVSSRGEAVLENIVAEETPKASAAEEVTIDEVAEKAPTPVVEETPVVQEPRIEVLSRRDGGRRYEERIEVVNKRTPGRYRLISTDAMREYMTAVGLMEPNFPQLFALMNEYQAQHPNGRGRKFSGVEGFSGAMLEIHLREAANWVSEQEEFGYVSEHGLKDGEVKARYLIKHGLITGVHIYSDKGARSNEIDCVRLVDGTPLGIETTFSKEGAPGLWNRTVTKRKILSRIYEDDCGIAVIIPGDIYATQVENTNVLSSGSYVPRSNLRHLQREGGIVVPFDFTRAQFQQAMLDFIPKELDRPELIINYEAA